MMVQTQFKTTKQHHMKFIVRELMITATLAGAFVEANHIAHTPPAVDTATSDPPGSRLQLA